MKARNPRHGSMGVWPRKRAKRQYSRVSSKAKNIKESKPLGFAGYKVGMTHVTFTDNRKASTTKGETISCPVTIIECPPLKICGVRFYKNKHNGLQPAKELAFPIDKDLLRKIPKRKKTSEKEIDSINADEYDDMTLIVYTQPKLTGLGKKKPELFEMSMGGNNADKITFVKDHLNKEIHVDEILQPGQQVDIHAVTKGKGYQGPVKRFGIGLKSHKSEKSRRAPGSLGGWTCQQHVMYRVAHAGQTGCHNRTDYNKWILSLDKDVSKINPDSGFRKYGVIKNPYIVLKGSILGPAKRMIRLNLATRPSKRIPNQAPEIKSINFNLKSAKTEA
ncbi:50S ribosomal protein L3 [Nanoarchaeota archaeon]